MTALTSYLRALIITYVTMGASHLGLPETGIDGVAEALAGLVVATVMWLVTKYAVPFLKKIGFLPASLILIGCSLIGLSSCATDGTKISFVYRDPNTGAKAVISTVIHGKTVPVVPDDAK